MNPDTANESLGPSDYGNRLADATKLLAFAGAVFYALGFLIVNIELGTYGIVSLELNRSEYVIVGFVWTFLVLVLPLLVYDWTSRVVFKRKWFVCGLLHTFTIRVAIFIHAIHFRRFWYFR